MTVLGPCKVRVATYNVLSSALASPTHFTSCKEDDLSFQNRLPRVLSKLGEETEKSSIICMQEISHEFTGPLHTFFAQNNYHFITGLYGRKFNNYMGIGLAFPLEKFEVKNVDVATLSDVREGGWPKPPFEEFSLTKAVGKIITKPFYWISTKIADIGGSILGGNNESYMVKLLKGSSGDIDHWERSKSRKNILLFAKLMDKDSQKEFGISTYHMPCCFFDPMVMNIHADMAMRRTQILSGDEPSILAGDFNLKPESPEYYMITKGALDEKDPTYPTPKYGMTWKMSSFPMKSAYAHFNGKEPDFTNYAKVRFI